MQLVAVERTAAEGPAAAHEWRLTIRRTTPLRNYASRAQAAACGSACGACACCCMASCLIACWCSAIGARTCGTTLNEWSPANCLVFHMLWALWKTDAC